MANCQCCGICGFKIEADEDLSDHQQINSLEAQLNAIFILKHIYKLKSDQLERYLQEWGNPGDWLKFCKNCEKDISNTRRIYEKFHAISKELERGKHALEQKIKDSKTRKPEDTTKPNTGVAEALDECPPIICNRNGCSPISPNISSNPSEAEDENAAELEMEIKHEILTDLDFCTDLDDNMLQWDDHSSSSAETNDLEASANEIEEELEEVIRTTPAPDPLEMTMTRRPTHTCPFCEKSFISAKILNKHIRMKVCLRFRCSECELRFVTRELLNEHLREVHGIIRDAQPNQKVELDLDMVTVSEDGKSGTCKICRRRYAPIRKLKKHLRKCHSGISFCQVESCGKVYKSADGLRRHIKKCHPV